MMGAGAGAALANGGNGADVPEAERVTEAAAE